MPDTYNEARMLIAYRNGREYWHNRAAKKVGNFSPEEIAAMYLTRDERDAFIAGYLGCCPHPAHCPTDEHDREHDARVRDTKGGFDE